MIIRSHRDLKVFNSAMEATVAVHFLTKDFPRAERWRLTDQVLRCSRSAPANLAEAWRKRGYRAHFISKLTDVQAEAAEVQVWLEFAHRVNYIDATRFDELFAAYEAIIAQTAVMSRDAHKWTKK